MHMGKPETDDANPLANTADGVRHALEALQKLRFGVIQLTVHEGKLVQVDVTERRRFTH